MDTPDPATTLTPFPVTVSRPERLFPKLTPAQLARVEAHGRRRSTTRGEVLLDVGDRIVPFFVVVSGEVYLELDDGAEVHLSAGDCVIQNGTRHAWHNRSSEKCVISVALIGAARKP